MNGPCPVCASPICAYVRDVPTVRTKTEIPLYACLDCRSFWNESNYREDDEQLRHDVDWGLSVAERNRAAAREVLDKIEATGLRFSSVAEIGCGIGTFLEVARSSGRLVVGFDTNAHAIAKARQAEIDAYAELWAPETETIEVDLYVCISVLEHLEEPRTLIRDLCQAAASRSAAVFISAPFLEKDRWNYILDPDPRRANTPFFDNDVHRTHVSIEGLGMSMREFGSQSLELIRTRVWAGILGTFDMKESRE